MTSDTALTSLAIVVPTRNRSELVELTLESIRGEAASVPVTAIVSDNSTSETEAALTEELVKRLQAEAHPHLEFRRIAPDRDLPMGDHWEWARRQAQALTGASHLMYLTDRTMLKRGALEVLLHLARNHPGEAISFNNDQVNDDEEPVGLDAQRASGHVHRVPTARLLDLTSDLIVTRPLPRALNTLVPVATLDRLAERYGDVFRSVAPDFCFCFRLLESSSHLVYVDRSLTVMHGLARSNGRSTTTGVTSKDTADFIKHGPASGIAPHAPLPAVATTYNVIASEYMRDGAARPRLEDSVYLRSLAAETDGFVDGPLRERNVQELEAAGQSFTPRAAKRRQLQRALAFLRALGPVDFALLTWDRLRQPPAKQFASKEEALDWARSHDGARSSGAALRYLRGVRLHEDLVAPAPGPRE